MMYTYRTTSDLIAHHIANRAHDDNTLVSWGCDGVWWTITTDTKNRMPQVGLFWRRMWMTPEEQIARAERDRIPY